MFRFVNILVEAEKGLTTIVSYWANSSSILVFRPFPLMNMSLLNVPFNYKLLQNGDQLLRIPSTSAQHRNECTRTNAFSLSDSHTLKRA